MHISKKKRNVLIFVTAFYFILILLNWISPLFNAVFIDNMLTTLTLLSGFFTFLYNYVDYVFLRANKMFMFFNKDTVSWKSSYKFYLSPDVDFENLNNTFLKKLEPNGYQISRLTKSPISCSFLITKGGYERFFRINYTKSDEYAQINLAYSSSTSYKDSKKEIDKFFQILDLYTKNVIEIDVEDPIILKPLYSASVSFEKSNPFYKLILRHTNDTKDVIFNLEFKEDNTTIKVRKNSLHVSSPEKNKIMNILENYLVFSSID